MLFLICHRQRGDHSFLPPHRDAVSKMTTCPKRSHTKPCGCTRPTDTPTCPKCCSSGPWWTPSGLDLYLSETEGLSADDWTTDSWANLVEAREAGLTLRADGASPSQEDVDATADVLAAAVAALEPAA